MEKKCTIVTITDKNFVLAVFILVLSLKYHKVKAKIKILGIRLSDLEKNYFSQFENVEVIDSKLENLGDRTSLRAVANISKREAILSAKKDDSEFIALLDGDCIATGDISPYLIPDKEGIFLRIRSKEENQMIFSSRYDSDDELGSIPKRILKTWRQDVHNNSTSNLTYTVLSGNLIVHKNNLNFIEHWGEFMEHVLPYQSPEFDHVAYEMMGDFTLSAMLAFSQDSPPVQEMMLDKDPQAYVAHLGPKPKFWEMWPRNKLVYFHQILKFLDWAEKMKIKSPPIPWTLKRKNTFKIYLFAYGHEFWLQTKKIIRPVVKKLFPDFKNRKHKY